MWFHCFFPGHLQLGNFFYYKNYHLIFCKFWGSQLHRWKVLSSITPQHGETRRWVPGFHDAGKKNFPPGKLRALAKHLGRVHQDVAATWCVFFCPEKKTWMFFWFDNPRVLLNIPFNTMFTWLFCWGKTQLEAVKMFFWDWEFEKCTHWMNPTCWKTNLKIEFREINLISSCSMMTAGFPWFFQDMVAETRQACIKIHANETIMTFQDLIPGNWFDRFTALPLFCQKPKKWVKNQWPQIYWDIFGCDIYLLFRYI